MLKVGDLVNTKSQDDSCLVPVCPLGVVVRKRESSDGVIKVITVRLTPEGYTNNYLQSDLEVVSNV